MPNGKLCFKFTELCNMSCPWCMADFSRKNRPPVNEWDDSTKQQFINCVNSGEYTGYSIAGGEPFVKPEILMETIDIIRKKGKNIPITIFTNGSLVYPDIVKYINDNNVAVVLAVSPSGYKSIDNMVKLSRCSNIIGTLRNINDFSVRYVYTVEHCSSYVNDMVTLYNVFGRDIECSADYLYLDKIDEHYINRLRVNLQELYSYPDVVSKVKWTLAHTHFCDCSTTNSLYADGSWDYIPIYHPEALYGCTGALHKMGQKLYNRYFVVVNNFNNRNFKGDSLCLI